MPEISAQKTKRVSASFAAGLSGGLNVYAYVEGNPIRFSDPTGTGPVGGVIGGYAGGILGGALGELIGPEGIPIGAALGRWGGRAAGSALEDMILMAQNNRQTRDRICGLQNQIDIHKKKLDQDPEGQDANHWRKEIRAWTAEIERLRRRLPNGK